MKDASDVIDELNETVFGDTGLFADMGLTPEDVEYLQTPPPPTRGQQNG